MALDFQQRRRRAMTLRRLKNKLARARERAKRRIATNDKLMKRARRAAIKIVRRRVAGKLGMQYNELPASQKMQIDARVAKRKALIDRIAKKLLPMVRRKEIERFKNQQNANREN